MPEQLDTKILPLLPLSTGVVLPGIVVTVTLETDEARATLKAARSAENTLLLVPRSEEGRYARVGTVARIEEMGRTPGGTTALVIRGLHLAEVAVKDRIRSEVAEGIDQRQREFILRQQLEAIKKELGEEDDAESVIAEYRKKIEEAHMPEGARTEAQRELGRLERMNEQSPEYGWIRTYLDWMTEIPWDVRRSEE